MYSSKITRKHRTAFVILCDQSGSMAEDCIFAGETMTKAEAETLIINMMLEELINRCKREYGVRDYFDLAVIAYCGDGVKTLLSENGKFIAVEQLANRAVPVRQRHVVRTLPEGGRTVAVVGHKWWIEGKASGNTPMNAALERTYELLCEWCGKSANTESFPPIVINITDGEATDATDGQLVESAQRIKSLATKDGNVLLFNIHLAGSDRGMAVSFPESEGDLPATSYARLLYEMSSILPECYERLVLSVRPLASPPFRAMGYNCPIEELYGMLSIGTVSSSFVL